MKTNTIVTVLVLLGLVCSGTQAQPLLTAKGYSIDPNQFAIPSNNPAAVFFPLKTLEKALTAEGPVHMRGFGKGMLKPIVIKNDLSILQYEAEGLNIADRSYDMANYPFDRMRFQSAGTLKT